MWYLYRLGHWLRNLLDRLDRLVHGLLEIAHGGRRPRLRLHLSLLATPLMLVLLMLLMLMLAHHLHRGLGMLGGLTGGMSRVAI